MTKWEDNQLIVVLSVEHPKSVKEGHSCAACSTDIHPGESVISVGVADRLEKRTYRWWICTYCEDLFSYPSIEDAPPYVQEWAYEKRLSKEIWYNGDF